MRVLALDHFFEHDLAALQHRMEELRRDAHGVAGDVMDVVSYRRLHRIARRHFPPEAFADLEAAFGPALTEKRSSYTRDAHAFADWLAGAYRPNVFIVPNDAIFYLRPVMGRLGALGVPTVCVQKETTIAPFTMDVESQIIRRLVPPMAAAMAVCSDRHREFALRCGAEPGSVTVTGQPRFDVYASARRNGSTGKGPPSILYLSFDDLAYLPADAASSGLGTWRPLRHEVEGVLRHLVESGAWRVVAKTHPQQRATDDRLGPGVLRAPRGADTRKLIMEADVVVGFQTTALFEAAMAGRPVLYTGWGPVYDATLPLLIPFHEHPDLATRVTSADDLSRHLAPADPRALPAPGPAARAFAAEHLGPVDGRASERVLGILREHAGDGPVQVDRPTPRARVPAAARGALSPCLRLAGSTLGVVGLDRLAGACRRRARDWAQEGAEARALGRGR